MRQNNTFLHRVLTGVAVCAMAYLFFHQAQLQLKPVPIAFEDTDVAFGYVVDTFSGTVYTDRGITTIGTGKNVALHINGAASKTTTTNASGVYSFSNVDLTQDDVVTVFINNATEDGVLVAKFDTTQIETDSITGMDIYQDTLILHTESTDRNITTTNLNTANNVGDVDVDSIYTLTNSNQDLQLQYGKRLYIWPSTTHTTSGAVYTHDLEVRGTLDTGAKSIVASGSVVITGAIDTTGNMTLTSTSSGELLHVIGMSVNNLYIDNGLEAYFRFDEGTGSNASGSTLNTGTGGSLTLAEWTEANSGTTLFYNPFALELAGAGSYVDFGDAFDINDSTSRKTFAGWFRRKSTGTEDVIFAKKAGSGTSTTGYILWADDTSNKLIFEVANGTNNYTVTSNSSVNDQDWHHVAVSYNPGDTDQINIFLDGAIDVAEKTGSLESSGAISGTFTNAENFRLGMTSTGSGAFHGTLDDFRIYSRVMSGSELTDLANGEKSTGSGTFNVSRRLDVDGDFGLYTGRVDVGTGYAVQFEGDVSLYGELKTNSGTVTLNGTAQTMRGSTAFHKLIKSVTSATTLTFESNTEQTVSGSISLQGAVSNRLSLRASVSDDQAYLITDDIATMTLKNLDVQDNNALSGALMSCTSGCINSENNVNWEFLGECQDGVVNTGEQCDDGNSNNFDRCPNDCQLAVCGDEVVEGLEECEPPNAGACLSNCLFRGAGGGVAGFSSNASAGSYFQRADPPAGCGNGILQPDLGEECDQGTRFNGLGACSFDCKKLTCGDGVVSPVIGEDCEPIKVGTLNGVTTFEVGTCGEVCTAPEVTRTGTAIGGCRRLFLAPCGASSSSVAAGDSRCGDGVVSAGEECDFGGVCQGGDFSGSFWTDGNSATQCVNAGGTPEPASGDGCSAECKTEFCGDGTVQARGADNQPNTSDDEQCDNGSVCSNDANKTCRLDSECGDGNTCEFHAAKDRSCSAECKTGDITFQAPSADCGNGVLESGEQCDEGARNGHRNSSCTTQCTTRVAGDANTPGAPICGNGIVEGEEECDAGNANSDTIPNTCRTNCTQAKCGDFVIDANEECDNGDGNSDTFADACRLDCTNPRCGDGVLDSNEQCDGSLSCQPSCLLALQGGICGNGFIESGEQCDDGNSVPGDGCSRFCQIERQQQVALCGNGITEAGEQCDDGNDDETDGCTTRCRTVEIENRKAAAKALQLDADVVIVNPTEFANALKFIEDSDACSKLVMKGRNQKAELIRAAAIEQRIPIIRSVDLAQSIFADTLPGSEITDERCVVINEIKEQRKATKPSAKPETEIPTPVQQPLPQAPSVFAQGFYPYAQVTPLVVQNPPAGDTGPGAIGIIIAGAAGGIGWMRRRLR